MCSVLGEMSTPKAEGSWKHFAILLATMTKRVRSDSRAGCAWSQDTGEISRPQPDFISGRGPTVPVLGMSQHVLGVYKEVDTHMALVEGCSFLSQVLSLPVLQIRIKVMQSEEGSAGPQGQ